MLLSRVADALYWISRYLERAEHTARLLDVAADLRLGRASTTGAGAIERLYATLGLAATDPADAVAVLTVHKAKGLEFPVVFLPGLVAGRFPLSGRGEPLALPGGLGRGEPPTAETFLAEERRLFYVACTRARRRLVVSAVDGAVDGGDAGATASRFLDLVAPERGDGPDGTRPHTALPRQLTLPALVAELRRHLTDPHTPAARRASAAAVLRRLAGES